jgi:hypothetical protein
MFFVWILQERAAAKEGPCRGGDKIMHLEHELIGALYFSKFKNNILKF